MAPSKVSPVTPPVKPPAGLRKRGRSPGPHRPVLLPLGTLWLKPTQYAEHDELDRALRNPPPGMGRKQYAVALMIAGLRGIAIAQPGEPLNGEDAPDAFFDV